MEKDKYENIMIPTGKNDKLILTKNTPFMNSQAIIIEYEDILKSPSFMLLYALKDNEFFDKLFDMSEIKNYDLEELNEWYLNRKHKNIFMNLPIREESKEFFKDENIFYDLLKAEYNELGDIIKSPAFLNFHDVMKKLFDSYLVHKVYVFTDFYCENIKDDLESLYRGNVTYVYGNLKDIIKEKKIPRDSTYVFSDVENILKLEECGALDLASIVVADDYKYNKNGDVLKIDIEKLLENHLFKIDFFDNTHYVS